MHAYILTCIQAHKHTCSAHLCRHIGAQPLSPSVNVEVQSEAAARREAYALQDVQFILTWASAVPIPAEEQLRRDSGMGLE